MGIYSDECSKHGCSGLHLPHSHLCAEHNEERAKTYRPSALKRVAALRVTHPHMFKPTTAELFWQGHAYRAVRAAKKAGILPELDGAIACDDCGKAATVYEHRDYGRPLDVVPVCGSCNAHRGTAIWPDASRFNFKLIEQK